MSKTIQKQKLEDVEIPTNAYAVIKELSVLDGISVEEYIFQMISALLQSDLENPDMFNCSQKVLDSICEKHGYDPEAWRRKEESA